MNWLKRAKPDVVCRFAAHARELYAAGIPVVLADDYNVVPTERDIYPTKSMTRTRLYNRKVGRPSLS